MCTLNLQHTSAAAASFLLPQSHRYLEAAALDNTTSEHKPEINAFCYLFLPSTRRPQGRKTKLKQDLYNVIPSRLVYAEALPMGCRGRGLPGRGEKSIRPQIPLFHRTPAPPSWPESHTVRGCWQTQGIAPRKSQLPIFPGRGNMSGDPHQPSFSEDELAVSLVSCSTTNTAPGTCLSYLRRPFTKPLWCLVCSAEKWRSF